MQDFLLNSVWAGTAICFVAASFTMAVLSGSGVMLLAVKIYYALKIQINRIQVQAEAEIARLKPQKQDELEKVVH